MTSFPRRAFFVGIDSDGCAFDTMELKHKECFIPQTILYYDLQPVSRWARETAEFVNLYSPNRGVNRFVSLVETLKLLAQRPEVTARGVQVQVPAALEVWVSEAPTLGNDALAAKVAETGDPDLARALAWSRAVNRSVAELVRGVVPFPMVRECLERLSQSADLMVISGTPEVTLRAEWSDHDLARHTIGIFGQESGTKRQLLRPAGDYPPDHALMIGDSPVDYHAARANQCLFLPITPGHEEASWRRFHDEGVERFLTGTFQGEYQEALMAEFTQHVRDKPPWSA